MTIAPPVQFVGDRMRVLWSDFSAGAGYELFKAVKRLPEYEVELDLDGLACGISAPARFASMLGVDVPELSVDWLPWVNGLFDDQRAIITMALHAKRFACWSDCGLGKTFSGLEWSRQVVHISRGGRVLIVTLNEIVPQWIDEAKKFYGDTLPIIRLNSREEMKRWCATGQTNDDLHCSRPVPPGMKCPYCMTPIHWMNQNPNAKLEPTQPFLCDDCAGISTLDNAKMTLRLPTAEEKQRTIRAPEAADLKAAWEEVIRKRGLWG